MNSHCTGRDPALAKFLLVAVSVWSAACAPDRPVRSTGELSAAALRSATYPNSYVDEGTVRLEGGTFEDTTRRVAVLLLPEYAVGDLDGDSVPDAAVVLATNSGGSGTFHDLVAVLNRDGRPEAAASVSLGDRVPTERIRIVAGRIELDVRMHGPGDPMCCPSVDVTRKFDLEEGTLKEIDPPAEVAQQLP